MQHGLDHLFNPSVTRAFGSVNQHRPPLFEVRYCGHDHISYHGAFSGLRNQCGSIDFKLHKAEIDRRFDLGLTQRRSTA
ncbi:hypothetical protein D3C81_2109240 [compost metagenome]